MLNIEYISGGIELLDLVEPLWKKLNKHHETNSICFKDKFRSLTFQIRRSKFQKDKISYVKIDLLKDKDQYEYIGYCISTVNSDLVGEIDSLYIYEDYRKLGLGDKLINSALEWLDFNKVNIKTIAVAEGNEAALEFYKRYGFYRRRTILEQIN